MNFRRELQPGGGIVVLSASVADAEFLGIPHGVDGPGADHGHLPGAVQPVSRTTAASRTRRKQTRLVLPRRRRMRRARNARRDHAGLAREARQPDLRHQLQPAAARRPGARQRQDHSGAGRRFPRRRLERHQGHLGRRLGSAAGEGRNRPAASSGWAKWSTASIRSTSSRRGDYIREALLRQVSGTRRSWSNIYSDEKLAKAAPRRARSGKGLRRLQGGRRMRTASRPSFWPRRSRATAWAKPAKAATSTHNQKKLNEEELREFRTRFGIPISDERRGRSAVLQARRTTAPEMKYLRERRKALGGSVPSRADQAGRRWKCRSWPTTQDDVIDSKASASEMSTTMGVVRCCRRSAARQEDRQVHRADRARRIAHVRHGRPVPPGRHLLARRPALRAGRFRSARSTTSEAERRPDSSKKASPKPARCRRSSPPARRIRRTACNMIPMFIYYSMFGFQRIGDLIWAAADMRGQGLHARRHGRPHDAQRRRPAASGRPQPS